MGSLKVLGVSVLAAGSLGLLTSPVHGPQVGPALARAAGGDPGCTGDYGGTAPVPAAHALRFGVDPGIAGNVGGTQLPTVPDDVAKDVSLSRRLRPAGHVLVVRLNRLFWSGGDPLIRQFQGRVAQYTRAGLEVELQVRYHPPPGEEGNLQAWQAYVRHVIDVFGPDPNVVAMTITNEVNVSFSPNTSDGSYTGAEDALIQGIEAAHSEAVARGYRQLQFGFTYAYRFSPAGDASFFSYLGSHGGNAFRRALGFVGVDFYPGSVYPPTIGPTDTYRSDTAQALGAVRHCFMGLADLGSTVPIWVTENGIPTRAGTTGSQQAGGLTQLVHAMHDYAGAFNVTDYRWFNLRDSFDAAGSSPRAGGTFATDGLLRADYTPKPAFAAYRGLIARFGRSTAASPVRRACPPGRFRLVLPRERRPIRRADVYLNGRHLGRAEGRRLRTVRVEQPAEGRFTVRIALRLEGGRRVTYRRRFDVVGCRLVARR